MGGSATLGSNLVDSLLSVVDDLRGSLHADMGVRQWRVFVRRRTWSGGRIGEGSPTDVDTELTPSPLVEPDDREFNTTPAGLEEDGYVTLREVSLTYTEAELNPAYVEGTETFYVLTDAHGQGLRTRVATLAEPPKPDRVESIGWVIRLRLSTDDGCQSP